MDVKRIRKALVAGVGGTVAAFVAAVQSSAPTTSEGWVGLIAGAVGAGVVVAWVTWRVPNAPVAPQIAPGRPPL